MYDRQLKAATQFTGQGRFATSRITQNHDALHEPVPAEKPPSLAVTNGTKNLCSSKTSKKAADYPAPDTGAAPCGFAARDVELRPGQRYIVDFAPRDDIIEGCNAKVDTESMALTLQGPTTREGNGQHALDSDPDRAARGTGRSAG
ncbi:hypothetical protein FW796_21805 [Pseudomonas sp. 910_21]